MGFRSKRKINFRLFRHSVPVLPFLILSTVFASSIAFADAPPPQTARKQIYSTAIRAAEQEIQQLAKEQEWPDYQAKTNVFIPTEVNNLSVCPAPLKSAAGVARQELSRMVYRIRCEGNTPWEVMVTIKPDIYMPIVVAKTTLQRGDVISDDNIQLKKYNISATRLEFITHPDKIMGLAVKKRIRDFTPITASQLEQPMLVKRGQQVIILAELEGISAQTVGEAMKNGRKGEAIKVRNLGSQKIVTAIVEEEGVVKVISPEK